MKKTEAKVWLRSVRSMRNYYLGKHDRYKLVCLFCDLTPVGEIGCNRCLWLIFSGISCRNYGARYFQYENVSDLRQNRDKRWVKLAFKRLDRWEKRLLEIIGE